MIQTWIYVIYYVLCILTKFCTSAETGETGNIIAREVYTGRHLNDMLTSSEDQASEWVVIAGVLVMYSSECKKDMQELLTIRKLTLPNEHFLVILKHNYEKYQKTVWYESDDEDNLYNRYMSKEDPCLKVLLWKPGSKLNQAETLTAGLGLQNFIWWKFFMDLKVSNELEEDITLKIAIPSGKVAHEVDVKSKNQAEYHTFASLMITVFTKQTGEFIYGELCSFNTKKDVLTVNNKLLDQFSNTYNTISNDQGLVDLKKWDQLISENQKQLSKNDNIWRDALKEMYLNTLVFPTYIPSFSLTGHETFELERDVFVPLVRFANSDAVSVGMTRESGAYTREPVINNREEATSVISISDQTRKTLIKALTEDVEQFAGCYVHMISAVLRQLTAKTIIRDHVDVDDNHVITALFALGDVTKSHDENIKPLEVNLVDVSGERKTIKLYPENMLLYESKTTIFSMRKPVSQKNPYIVIEAYFEPSKNWSWKYSEENGKKVLTNGEDIKVMMSRPWPPSQKASRDHHLRSHKKYGVKQEAKGTMETDPISHTQHIEL